MLRNPRQEGGRGVGGSVPPSLSPRTPLSYQGDQHPNILTYVGMSKAADGGARMGSERWLPGLEAVRASLEVVVVERAWDASAILGIRAPAGLGRPRPESRRL